MSAAAARFEPLGVWATTDGMPADTAVAFARRVEELGYSPLWLPETMGRDPFAHIAHLAGATDRLRFATGIANVHHRHPGAMLQAANTLGEQTGGRFVLGLGVSHAPLVEGLRGLDYGKPVATMRRYLEAMATSPYMSPAPAEAPPRLVGALGPKMVELAGELADGVHPYWTTPEHTAGAREILGTGKLVCVEQKVVLGRRRRHRRPRAPPPRRRRRPRLHPAPHPRLGVPPRRGRARRRRRRGHRRRASTPLTPRPPEDRHDHDRSADRRGQAARPV